MPTKTLAEPQVKPAAAPPTAKQPSPPDKQGGSAHPAFVQRAASGATPPAGGDAPPPSRAADVLGNANAGSAPRASAMRTMQGTVGNARLSRMLGATVQARLAVSRPDDTYEREANSVAETMAPEKQGSHQSIARISRLPVGELYTPANGETAAASAGPRMGNTSTASRIRTSPADGGSHDVVDDGMQARITSPSGGRPLPDGVRRDMEAGLGADFSNVRVHDTTADQADARRLNARAFTHGHDIWLGEGASTNDRKLMAHELTHVVQQGKGVRRQPLTTTPHGGAATMAPAPGQAGPVRSEPTHALPALDPETQGGHHGGVGEEGLNLPASHPSGESEHAAGDAHAAGDMSGGVTLSGAAGHEVQAQAQAVPTSDHGATALAPPAFPTSAGSADHSSVVATEHETQPTEAAPHAVMAATTPRPLPSATQPSQPQVDPGTPVIQRDGEEGGGLLDRLRRRISGIVDGLRAGWSRLGQMAEDAVESIRGHIGGLIDGLRTLVTTAISGIQGAWSALTTLTRQLTEGLTRHLQGAVSTVMEAVQGLGQALLHLDAAALRAAWARLIGLLGGVWQGLQQAGQAVLQRIAGLWQDVRARFTSVASSLANGARAVFKRLQSAAQGLQQRLSSAWDAVRTRASQLSGVLGGILDRLRALLGRLLSWGQEIWAGIQQQWSALGSRVSGVLQRVQSGIATAWQGLRLRAMAMWNRLGGLWNRLQSWVRRQIQRLTNGVRAIWSRFAHLAIEPVIAKIAKYATIIRAVEQAVANPDAAMAPIVNAIAGKLERGMPAKATELGRQRLQEQVGGPGGMATAAQSGSRVTVQRQAAPAATPAPERSTATWREIWHGFSEAISYKWKQVNVWQMVKDMLLSLVWPWPAIGRELKGLWDDIVTAWHSLFAIRNVFSDPLGALHDLWTNILHLLDIPLAILRRLTNILLLLLGIATIILVVGLGAIGGILGSLLGPGGTAVGILAGAAAGFAVAGAVGEVLFAVFVALQGDSIIKALLDLKTGLQTREEKQRNYNQLADSLIALGVALVLFVILWLAAKLASIILDFVKGRFAPEERGEGGEGGEDERPTETAPRTIIVDTPARLQASEPRWVPDDEYYGSNWEWSLSDKESGAEFCQAHGRAPDSATMPSNLELDLDPTRARMPDGSIVRLEARGFKWTPESLRLAMEAWKKRFGSLPSELSGEIEKSNLANFQREYARIRTENPGLDTEEIGARAASQISFGKARIPLGYSDFRVRMDNFGDELVPDPNVPGGTMTLPNVPRKVYIEARPTGGGAVAPTTPGGGTTP